MVVTAPWEASDTPVGEAKGKGATMTSHPRRSPPGPLHVVRIAGDAARTRRAVWFLGVEHTEPAIRAHRLRTTLHRVFVLASAMPRSRHIHDLAREAAQDPGADLASLRCSLEGVMALAASGRAPKLHDLARDELGADYLIVA